MDIEIDMQHHKLTIQTPEGVRFNLSVAGPVIRCLAWMIDAACIMACFQLCMIGIKLLGMIHLDFFSAVFIMVFFIFRTGYTILMEWHWRGQTVGKKVLGLRVMDAGGLRLQPGQIIIRNLIRAVDSLPLFYLVGGATCLASRNYQRLGDLAAGTIVVTTHQTFMTDLDFIMETNHYNSLRTYPHLMARIRQHVTPEEASLALQALQRRDELLPEARVVLFDEMAAHFKSKVVFPQEAQDGVSDEQYVRNVVDVLFKTD